MVERPLSMREVPGSIPGFSMLIFLFCVFVFAFVFYLKQDNVVFAKEYFSLIHNKVYFL